MCHDSHRWKEQYSLCSITRAKRHPAAEETEEYGVQMPQ